MSSHRVVLSVFLAAGLTAASGNVSADADVDAFYNTGKPKLEEAAKLVKEGKFGEAVPVLSAYVKSEPGSADGWNLLAYSQRKLGRFGPALKNYDKALSIDPDHKGAHEYL
ncbi:MAG: tetratricopeptide repeat protein, partial [Rhodospirillales bacterium]